MREGICNYFAVCFIKKGLFDTYKDRKKRRVQAVKEESGEKKRGNTFQMQSWKPRQPPRVVLQSDLRSTPSPKPRGSVAPLVENVKFSPNRFSVLARAVT